jgi:alkylation response protein AidB-like acyl-CoA dehydrogenase
MNGAAGDEVREMRTSALFDTMRPLLTREQTELWRSTADFALNELDDDIDERETGFSRANWNRCAEFGVIGLPVPTAFGGRGADVTTAVLAFDALGYAHRDNGLLFSIGAHLWSCVMTLARHGTPEQRRRYLPDLCGGGLIAAHAMTEPGTGSDAFALRTTADPVDGGWALNGVKTFITNAPVADVFVVFAAEVARPSPYGILCLLVDASTPGVAVGPAMDKMGLRTSPMSEVRFEDCFVPEPGLVGRPGMGMAIFNEAIHLERACILASALGTMQRQIERSAHALKPLLGRARGYEIVADRLAEMAARLYGSRLLAYELAQRIDAGRTKPAESALVKVKLSEAFVDNSRDAHHNDLALGGPAARECEREIGDAAAGRIYSGTNEIQRNIIARGLGLR